MKKLLLLITSFCIGILNAGAQITITTADMPSPTKVFYEANDTLPTISIGNAGISQTWSMTALAQHTTDTSYVVPYSSAPNPVFSSANLAVQQGSQNFYGYLMNSPSGITLLGGGGVMVVQGTPIAVNQISTPAEILFNFPTSYDSSFTNNYSTDATFYFGQTVQGVTVDSIQQRAAIKKTFLVDGWGTLTTPLAGGPYNVLRTKETKITHDTTRAYISMFSAWTDISNTVDSTTTYSWWANGFSVALATATMDSTGAVSNVKWLTAPPIAPPILASVSSTNVSCPSLCDGTAHVSASWGYPPYTYSWNTNPVQNSSTATALCAGTYTVMVTDSLLATDSAIVTINNPPQPVITANGTTLHTNTMATSFQWYLNNVLITGATSSSYSITQNGNYIVTVSNGSGCYDTSAVFNFNTIGINESSLDNSFSIYPNPATNLITIKFNASISLIEIKNELGQSIKKLNSKQVPNGKNEMAIDISDLPVGIYFVQIQSNNSTVNKKFIKQ